MSAYLLVAVGLVYAYVAGEHLWRGNIAGFAVFTSYCSANIALIWYLK